MGNLREDTSNLSATINLLNMEDKKPKFNIGDSVRIKSDGKNSSTNPPMIIEKFIWDNKLERYSSTEVYCIWNDGSQLVKGRFKTSELILVSNDQ